MLTHEKLVELYRELKDEPVLSVYLDADQKDPAQRTKWKKQLESLVSQARQELPEGDRDEHERFEEAWTQIQEALRNFDAFIPGRGWVGFATSDQLWYSEEVPTPMPDLVRWEDGIRVAPYIRGLKQSRPVVVVLVDSQKARVFEYRDGEIEEHDDLRADTFLGDLSDVGVRKRSVSASGMRGETATDQAQRILEVSSERMLKELVGILADRAGDDGFLVVGGTPEAVKRAAEGIPRGLRERAAERPSMHLGMSLSEVKEVAEEAASALTTRQQSELLDAVLDAARSGGRACLGPEETEKALREMRVDTLLLSRSFIAEDPDYADRCVGTAFAQGADVEELGVEAGERLHSEADGVAARLRFRIRSGETAEEASAA